ncbi:hypothetical protein C4N9_00190 [Pararhodobacter marinus]|uniref:Acyl-CoA dehydrogenase n=1 Tax=Pararhodobacter marinus TaxID=2184063 RepID=A0A2U2CHW9_9RHOB|nr:acyl-CoA dehydrogenase family protein [Pararhodobacter marinus]PWE31483.1 hypothetical protein C4N9_00190 [Pararhodobacter marinus]
MAALSSDDRQMLVDSAETLLARAHNGARLRRLRDQGIAFDAGFWRLMGDAGWLGLRLPEAAGGSDLGAAAAVALAEVMGRHAVPDPYVAACHLPAVLLGDSDVGAALATGEIGVAVMEGEVPLRGPAEVAVGATVPGGEILLLADRGNGAEILLLRLAIAPELRADGGAGGRVSVTARDLAAADVLLAGSAALGLWQKARDEAALVTAGYLTGLARQALALSVEHLLQREQFGQKLAQFQVLQHRVVDLRIGVRLAEAALGAALAAPEDRMRLHAAKARASAVASATTRQAVQLHGALGFTDEAAIGLYLKLAMHHAQAFGSEAAHRTAHARLSREARNAA